MGLAALGDDPEAVVGKVSEAIGPSLDEFHFSVETFGDAIVAGEAPHAQLRAPAEFHAGSNTQSKLVHDFRTAGSKVVNADRSNFA